MMIAATRRRGALLVFGTIVLAACGSKSPGPGPTPAGDPPRISCPADLSVTGVAVPQQAVTFAAPTVTDGTSPVSVTCSPASGATFPLGNTAVSCAASDARSRTASCSFNVTLKGFTIGVTKFLAFGDSVTEGQNGQRFGLARVIDSPNAYPTKLQSLLDASFPGQAVTVVNRGSGGEFIEAALARLPAIMAAERPGAVLLIDGYNNLLRDCPADPGPRPACIDAIEFVAGKLRECARTARSGGAAHVFVATLTPPGPYVPTPGSDNRRIDGSAITKLNARIKSQLPAEGAIIVDVHALFLGHEAEFTGPDGLHLFPPGNQAMADAFFAAITATVPQTPALTSPGAR